MEISDLIRPETIAIDLKAASKKQLLEELARRIAPTIGQDERHIFDTLLEREKLGTTGVGQGIAIPHGKLASLERIYGFFARLKTPVDFDAIDEQPVDLVFLLVAPESAGADHLKALARISRLLRDAESCETLRRLKTAEEIYAFLTRAEASNAA